MNIYEFAKALGLSIGTVSRAINGRKGVSPDTRALVLRRMRELGFRPNRAAAALAAGRTRTIALWTPGLTSSYVSAIVARLERIVEDDDYDLAVVNVARKRESSDKLLDLSRWPVDGIIALDAEDWLRPVVASGSTPVVSVGVYAYQDGADYVTLDLGGAVEHAVEHLITQGCRRVAMVLPYTYDAPGLVRRDTYLRVVERHGMPPEFVKTRSLMRAQAIRAIRDYVQRHGHPDGMFCFNDDLGIAAFRGVRDLGLQVPRDVLIIGCDGVEETLYHDPPLATIDAPISEMCALAWRYLCSRIEAPETPARGSGLSARLVVRASAVRPDAARSPR